jgi:hypothetical protein
MQGAKRLRPIGVRRGSCIRAEENRFFLKKLTTPGGRGGTKDQLHVVSWGGRADKVAEVTVLPSWTVWQALGGSPKHYRPWLTTSNMKRPKKQTTLFHNANQTSGQRPHDCYQWRATRQLSSTRPAKSTSHRFSTVHSAVRRPDLPCRPCRRGSRPCPCRIHPRSPGRRPPHTPQALLPQGPPPPPERSAACSRSAAQGTREEPGVSELGREAATAGAGSRRPVRQQTSTGWSWAGKGRGAGGHGAQLIQGKAQHDKCL